jgi:hypothetical protein
MKNCSGDSGHDHVTDLATFCSVGLNSLFLLSAAVGLVVAAKCRKVSKMRLVRCIYVYYYDFYGQGSDFRNIFEKSLRYFRFSSKIEIITSTPGATP